MAKWEVESEPEWHAVVVPDYDKILDQVAELLYRHCCQSEKPLDHKINDSSVGRSTTEPKGRLA